jgi:hypothetical protein
LLAWGYEGDTNCVFCRNGTESRDHLFFSCGFSSRIWKTCLQRCDALNPPTSWDGLIEEGCRTWKTKSLMGSICKLILSSAVYGLWRTRNEIKFGSQPRNEEQILKLIFWEVRFRVSGKGKFKKTLENINLCHKWNIDVNILS